MEYTKLSCEEFTAALSSKAPVPGGGGASAMTAALGIALGNMVAELTIGKKKYQDVEAVIRECSAGAKRLQAELLELVEADAQCFEPLSKAYSLPQNTAAEQQAKKEVMESALREACRVPLEIMEKVCETIALLGEFADKGSVLAISDAGTGAAFSKAALQGASLNVFVNTRLMADREYAEKCNAAAERMLKQYEPAAEAIFLKVKERLNG